MRRFRFHIGTLVILVLLLGVGFADLRESNETWDSSIFSLTLVVLLTPFSCRTACTGGQPRFSGQHPRIPAGTSPEASPAGSGFPGSELVSRDDDQTRLLEPAGDHRPVPAVTVTIHRVLALDRVAIEPAHHPGSPRRAIECPAHGVDTPGADVESR